MKNFFAMIFFTAFIFISSGCGDNSPVDDIKKDAASKVQDVANEVSQKAAEIANDGNSKPIQEISLAGISPGMTFEEIKSVLGEPTSSHDHDEFIFSNGVIVEFDDHRNVAKEIKSRQNGIAAAGGVAIGMSEQNLLDAYGNAEHKDFDDGGIEYKYFSSDRTKKIEFKVVNGTISEIKCELD